MNIFGFKIKKRILSLPVLFLFFILIYIVFIEEEKVNKHLKDTIGHKAEFTINGFKLFESQKDGKDWNLKANYAEIHRNKNQVDLTTVNLILFNNDGKIFKLYSDKAILYTNTKKVVLIDNIKVFSDDGYTITTDSAIFHSDKQIIESQSDMVFNGPELYVTGTGFKGNIKEKTVNIFSKVVTKVKSETNNTLFDSKGKDSSAITKLSLPPEKTKLTINSRKCDFNFLTNQVIYTKNVVGAGKGFTLNTSKLIINYQVKKGVRSVKDILALGEVVIKKEHKTATSQKAYLVTDTKNITLTGDPIIIEKDNTLKGDKIVYNYETEKTDISAASGKYSTK